MPIELQKQEREIGGVIYEVTPLPFGIGQKALMRFLRIAAPLLAAATGKDKDGVSVGAAVMKEFPSIVSDSDLEYFSKVFGDTSRYESEGKRVPLVVGNQEHHFAGRYYEYFQWLVFCLEVNFRGFFAGMMRAGNDGALQGFLKTA